VFEFAFRARARSAQVIGAALRIPIVGKVARLTERRPLQQSRARRSLRAALGHRPHLVLRGTLPGCRGPGRLATGKANRPARPFPWAVNTHSLGFSPRLKPALTWPTGRVRACRAPIIKPTARAASFGPYRAAGCRTRRLRRRWGQDLDSRRPLRWLTGCEDEHGLANGAAPR